MYSYKHPHPAVTVDIVIFTLRDEQLQLLLIKRAVEPHKGQWALPGGFVRMDEDLDTAARRELEEETGIQEVYLEQLYSFGSVARDPRERVITVAYFALIPSDKIVLQASTDADEARWFPMDKLPPLAFDHQDIVGMAEQRLMAKLDYSTIAFQFLPDSFTLTELQKVYESILQEALDKRNFRKWALALEQIEETGEMKRDTAARPAKLYHIKDRNKVDIIR